MVVAVVGASDVRSLGSTVGKLSESCSCLRSNSKLLGDVEQRSAGSIVVAGSAGWYV